MNIQLLSLGDNMPNWVAQSVNDYQQRLRQQIKLSIVEIPLPKRVKSSSIASLKKIEGEKLLSKIKPNDWVVAADINGKAWTTEQLAQQLNLWQESSKNVHILIGGPDGLSTDCLQRANQRWSLSNLTLPHPLVRVIICEQIYRASSILQHHPYHRA